MMTMTTVSTVTRNIKVNMTSLNRVPREKLIALMEKKVAALDKQISKLEVPVDKSEIAAARKAHDAKEAKKFADFQVKFRKAAKRIVAMNAKQLSKLVYDSYDHPRYCPMKAKLPEIPMKSKFNEEAFIRSRRKGINVAWLKEQRRTLLSRISMMRLRDEKTVTIKPEQMAKLLEGT